MSREIVYSLGDVEVEAYTGTAATTATTNANRGNVVRLWASTDCHFTTDGTTATANKTPLTAGLAEYIYRPAGATISVIQASTGGNLFVAECSV